MSSRFLIIFYNKIYKALSTLTKDKKFSPSICNFNYSNVGIMSSKTSEIEILSIV